MLLNIPKQKNNPGYDMLITKENEKYIAQVKSDANNDGKFPEPETEQLESLKKSGKLLKRVPLIVYYNMYTNNYTAKYVNINGEKIFK